VERLRKRTVTEGVEAALEERLTALACSEPPTGRQRWTLQLLAQEFGNQESGAQISYETVRRTLKKAA
jgi:hypothetical protein